MRHNHSFSKKHDCIELQELFVEHWDIRGEKVVTLSTYILYCGFYSLLFFPITSQTVFYPRLLPSFHSVYVLWINPKSFKVHLWPLSAPLFAFLSHFPVPEPPECAKRQIVFSHPLVQRTPDIAKAWVGDSTRDIWGFFFVSLLHLEQCWWLSE